jgi:Na+-transporting NADH:ubiquinone oxidoreductase subunit NqrD
MILNSRFFRIFWGPASPLYTLAGTALLIMASARTAFALITLGALVWVYTLTAAAIRLARRFLPKRGRSLVIIGISSALGGLYLLVLYLLNPLLALESTLYILLAPVCCYVSALLDRIETLEGSEGILEALLEALLYGALLFALALIREFMGLGALSLPGGSGGMVELFRRREFSLIPVRFLDSAAGALLLLGYGIAFFNRLLKTRQDAAAGREEPK